MKPENLLHFVYSPRDVEYMLLNEQMSKPLDLGALCRYSISNLLPLCRKLKLNQLKEECVG